MSLLLLIVSSGKPELSHFWAVIPCGMWADCRWIMRARTEPELCRNCTRTGPDQYLQNSARTEPELGQTNVSRTGPKLGQTNVPELIQNWARPMFFQNWAGTGPDQSCRTGPRLGRSRPMSQPHPARHTWAFSGPSFLAVCGPRESGISGP